MFRKVLMIGAICTLPMAAAAQSVQDSIIAQLQAQGFDRIEVSRTLLGRVVLNATSNRLERELVFNPVTGEILRDYWEERGDENDWVSPRVLVPNVGNRSSDDRRTTASGNNDRSERSARDDDDDDREDRADDHRDRDDDRRDRDDDRDDRDDDDDDDDRDDDN